MTPGLPAPHRGPGGQPVPNLPFQDPRSVEVPVLIRAWSVLAAAALAALLLVAGCHGPRGDALPHPSPNLPPHPAAGRP